jgi:hypothetical protein
MKKIAKIYFWKMVFYVKILSNPILKHEEEIKAGIFEVVLRRIKT